MQYCILFLPQCVKTEPRDFRERYKPGYRFKANRHWRCFDDIGQAGPADFYEDAAKMRLRAFSLTGSDAMREEHPHSAP